MKRCFAAMLALCSVSSADAAIRITEWAYQGGGGEFIELTNVGGLAADLTGWSFDDDSRLAGTVDLSSLGTLQPDESAIIAESADTDFRTFWGLAPTVKVFGSNTTNLGRNDEINIYDASNALVDRLTFGDQNIPGTIRTQNISGWTTPGNLGTNNVAAWVLSAVNDAQQSYTSLAGDIGNPGTYVVPEPVTMALLIAGAALLMPHRRKLVNS